MEEHTGGAHFTVMWEIKHGAPLLRMPGVDMLLARAIGDTVPRHATMTQVTIQYSQGSYV